MSKTQQKQDEKIGRIKELLEEIDCDGELRLREESEKRVQEITKKFKKNIRKLRRLL